MWVDTLYDIIDEVIRIDEFECSSVGKIEELSAKVVGFRLYDKLGNPGCLAYINIDRIIQIVRDSDDTLPIKFQIWQKTKDAALLEKSLRLEAA
jgi:hypothetical protein